MTGCSPLAYVLNKRKPEHLQILQDNPELLNLLESCFIIDHT